MSIHNTEVQKTIELKIDDNHKDEETESTPLQEKPNQQNEDKEKKKLTFMERLKLIKDNTTVEPIMLGYTMPSVLASLAIQNLNLEKACRVNLNYSTEACDALTLRETELFKDEEEQVQLLIASIQAWKNVIQTAIPFLIILFVGAWSDKTGKRKACILVPIIGELLTCLGFIVNKYFFYELPAEVASFTEAIFPAITGGWFTNFVGVFSYIGDVTTEKNRTFRVGILSLTMNLGYPMGSALSGILLRWIGYYGIFSLSSSLYVISLVYGYYCLKDPEMPVSNKSKNAAGKGLIGFLREFFDVKLVKETFKVAFKQGPRNRRLRVCMLLIVVCVVFGPMHGEFSMIYLFARYRFNWDEVQFSVWSTYSMLTNSLGTLFSVSLFSKHLKLDDTILGIISNTSKIVASFAYAFARTDFEIYMAPLVEILNGTSFIAMRSIASKLVSGKEFGKVNSLFGLAEASMPMIYGPLYSWVYMATLEILPGAVFLLGAVLTIPSIIIFAWLYMENRKDIATEETKMADVEK